MLYEYLINLRCHFYDSASEQIIIGWGKDEYDALNKAISKDINYTMKNDPLFKVDKRDYDYSICRLRPTGRAKEYGDYIKSYFDVDVRPYIKGLMTRFMLRFIVADTIEEINNYKKEFDGYLERYGHEFPKSIKNRILKQYEDKKQLIKLGVVKPLSINFHPRQMEINPEAEFDLYLQQAIAALKMFGFRIKKINGKYNISVPEQYYRVKANLDYYTKAVSPVELILLWTWNEDYTYSYNKGFYGIKNNEPPLKYLGSQYDDEEIKIYCEYLEKEEIKPFYFYDIDSSYNLYVLKNQYDKSVEIFRINRVRFSDPDYDEDSFLEDVGYRTCEICGCRFSGDDTVCPSCVNNID